jgi:hypothetical protein
MVERSHVVGVYENWRISAMRYFVSCVMGLAATVLLFAACNSNDSQMANREKSKATVAGEPGTPGDGIARITVSDLKAEVDKGTAIIVDVRAPEAYDHEHIKGAVNITDQTLDSRLAELPRNKKIVAYCS